MKRRSFLATLAAGAVAVSGCVSNVNSHAKRERLMSTPTEPVTKSGKTYTNCLSDVDMIQHQNFNGEIPICWNENISNIEGIYIADLERLREDEWYTVNGIVSTSNQREALQYKKDLDGIEQVEEFIEDTDLSNNTIIINYWKISEYQRLDIEFVKWGKSSGFNDEVFNIAMDLEFSDINNDYDYGSLENMIVTVIRISDEIERASFRTGNVDRLADC